MDIDLTKEVCLTYAELLGGVIGLVALVALLGLVAWIVMKIRAGYRPGWVQIGMQTTSKDGDVDGQVLGAKGSCPRWVNWALIGMGVALAYFAMQSFSG